MRAPIEFLAGAPVAQAAARLRRRPQEALSLGGTLALRRLARVLWRRLRIDEARADPRTHRFGFCSRKILRPSLKSRGRLVPPLSPEERMGLSDADKLDYLTIDASGTIVLTLADDFEGDDEVRHLALLQAKLNHYLE